jgi:hypothetical protein
LQWSGDTAIAVELGNEKDCRLPEKHEIAKQSSMDIQREEGIWEEGGRDLSREKYDESPARPARHKLPSGKQGEDKHEQGKSEEAQTFVQHLPGGETRRHRARRDDWAKRHEH